MGRWLSPSPTPLAEWLWVQSTATGAIVPIIEATAGMTPPILNNGAVDPALTTAQAGMAAPSVTVDTGLGSAPVLVATANMPAAGLELKETTTRATGTAAMRVPVVSKTVVCFPKNVTFTITGKVPSIPVGTGKFPSGASLTLTGRVPTVSSITPTTVTPTAASFTITGHAPALPTGPRFPYQLPITLN